MEFVVKLVVLSSAAVGLSTSQFGKEPSKMAGFRTGHLRQKQFDNRFSPPNFSPPSLNPPSFTPPSFSPPSFIPDDFNHGFVDTDDFNLGPDIHGQFGERQPPLQVATPVIPILYEDKQGPDASGVYSFSFESADGTRRQESGRPTSPDTFSVQGSYSYISPEGIPFEVRYVADEFGFRAEGDHLPTPPPAPLHALQQIQAAEEAFSRQRNEQQTPVNFQDPFVNIIPPTANFQQFPSFQHRGKSLHQETEKDSHHNSSSDIDHQVDLTSHEKFESKRNAESS
ncbi:uncharacterized protein [Palaemon carinicauda]|uniref:uncharacterized protein n=1 Tax=Palaemon carinicauda TaxID=392227 RepID=UPI0035B5CD42